MTNDSQNTTDDRKFNFNVSAIQVGNKVMDGDEFILVTRNRQSSEYRVWSSGDAKQTESTYRAIAPQFQNLRQAEPS